MAKLNNKLKEKQKKKHKDDTARKFQVTHLVLLMFSITAFVIIFIIYKQFVEIPEMPDIDFNVWWGPNNTKNKQDTSIRPFRIIFTDSMQLELQKKFILFREREKTPSFSNSAWSYGINSEAVNQVFNHWQYKYIFRERQRFLNKFDQFKTNIQGLDIHFAHVKPKVENNVKVLPLLIMHGWPGSIREFYEAIPLLTTPRPGYDFVFEVIAPSLPGFTFSQAASRSGLSPFQIAIIMRNLMHRLGFQKFYIQGGDFGHSIGSNLCTLFPEEVLGFHSNFLADFSPLANLKLYLAALWPSLVVDEDKQDRAYPLKDKLSFFVEETGYFHLQTTKPDTIGAALNDSPLGLAAYILDKFMVFTDYSNKNVTDGGFSKYFDLISLLDNIMLYWVTGSITTSMRLYKESIDQTQMELLLSRIPTPVPTWGLKAKYEVVYQPDCILKTKYPNLTGSTYLKDGGHFLAFEKSDVFADNVFKAVNSFINFHKRVKEEL